MGIGCSGPDWWIRVTHIPTGIEVVRTSRHFRSQHKARDAAMKYLKSLLYVDGFKEDDCKVTEENNDDKV